MRLNSGVSRVKTYDIHDPNNRLLAFEISNTFVGRRVICRMVELIPGATIIRRPKALSWLRESSFCEFTLDGEVYEIEEPYGDSSRYWIGPVPPRHLPQTLIIRDAFARPAHG